MITKMVSKYVVCSLAQRAAVRVYDKFNEIQARGGTYVQNLPYSYHTTY
jgi:hypothetical protein